MHPPPRISSFPTLLFESDNCIPYFQERVYIAEKQNIIPRFLIFKSRPVAEDRGWKAKLSGIIILYCEKIDLCVPMTRA